MQIKGVSLLHLNADCTALTIVLEGAALRSSCRLKPYTCVLPVIAGDIAAGL